MHIKNLLNGFLFLFLFFILSCQGKRKSGVGDISLSELKPELVVSLSGKKVKLSEINTDGNYVLSLSDVIFFDSLKQLKGFQKSVSGREVMEVSSTCLMNRERYTLNKKFSYYQPRFYILDLLSEKLFLDHKKKNPVSCSFLFIIRDKGGNEYLYNIPLLPLLSVGEDSSLKILNDKNKALAGQVVNKDNMNHFDLILEQGRKAQKIKFLCEELLEKEMIFLLSREQSLISPFKLLQSMKTEQLPYGKKKCRILTYEKMASGSGTGSSRQTYMANGISGSFYIDFETLHEKTILPESDLFKKEPVIKSQTKEEVKLSEIKAGKKYTLNLSDEILFIGLSALSDKKTDSSGQIEESISTDVVVSSSAGDASKIDDAISPVMEVLTTCLMKQRQKEPSSGEMSGELSDLVELDRWTLEKKFMNYQSRLYIIDLLPEELFINYRKESLISCSLSFIVRDTDGNSYSHNIPSLPVHSIEKSVFLKFLNVQNKEVGMGDIVDTENMNHFSVILEQERKAQKIKFLCEGEEQQISFNLNPGVSIFAPFQFLQSLQKEKLPSGKKRCRILTYGNNQVVNGMTGFFQIHFETLKNQNDLWMPQAEALHIEINTFASKEISQLNKRQRNARGREDPIHITSVFEIPELFEILPENFTKEDYHSYRLRVDTECFSSILHKYKGLQRENFATETYYLPLLDSVSVMSVTSREALQVYLPDNLLEMLAEIHPDYLPPNSKSTLAKKERDEIQLKDYHQWITCSYHFQIQNRQGDISSVDWIKNRPIHWNQGSYGLGFKEKKAKKSFPLTFQEAKSIEADLLFLQDVSKPNDFFPEDSLWPDKVTFLCGGRHPSKEYKPVFQTTYEKSISMQQGSLKIPLSFFIDTDDFFGYLKDNKFIKCRIILEKQGILRYFSQDLKFIYEDEKFFKSLNNLSEDDTFWNFNSLSRFLYWL